MGSGRPPTNLIRKSNGGSTAFASYFVWFRAVRFEMNDVVVNLDYKIKKAPLELPIVSRCTGAVPCTD